VHIIHGPNLNQFCGGIPVPTTSAEGELGDTREGAANGVSFADLLASRGDTS
jgi:hypothetical protein